MGLLDSACHRPAAQAWGHHAYPDLLSKAAALLQSLTNNHALVGGNKRTAGLATVVLLRLKGATVTAVDGYDDPPHGWSWRSRPVSRARFRAGLRCDQA